MQYSIWAYIYNKANPDEIKPFKFAVNASNESKAYTISGKWLHENKELLFPGFEMIDWLAKPYDISHDNLKVINDPEPEPVPTAVSETPHPQPPSEISIQMPAMFTEDELAELGSRASFLATAPGLSMYWSKSLHDIAYAAAALQSFMKMGEVCSCQCSEDSCGEEQSET